MEKKKRAVFLLGILWTLLLSGCLYYRTDARIGEDGTGTFKYTVGYEDAFYQEMLQEGNLTETEFETIRQNTSEISIHEKTYYCQTTEQTFSSGQELEDMLVELGLAPAAYVTADTFFLFNERISFTEEELKEIGIEDTEDIEDMQKWADSMVMEISVTFPKPISSHKGGSLSNEDKTITWEKEYMNTGRDLYATTITEAVPAVMLSSNIKEKTYKKAQTIVLTGGAGSAYLDGVRVTSKKTKAKDGAHTLILLDDEGSKQVVNFIVDTKAPTITGVKNHKTYKKKVRLYVYDEASGVQYVKVNGRKLSKKQIANGYTIKKNGTYTVKVMDKAKHKKSITFTIQKK